MEQEGAQAAGTLHKAVVTILGSPQLRDVLLYTTLLLIVATAFICDRWPDFAVPAVVIALLLIGGEGLVLYLVIKRLRAPAPKDGSSDLGTSK